MLLARYMCSDCLNATLSSQLRLNSLKYTSLMCFDRPRGVDLFNRNSNDECPCENWTHVLF